MTERGRCQTHGILLSVPVTGPGTAWDTLTGGMDNLLQGGAGGLVGTVVGIAGALLVARWTTRHELARAQEAAHRAASVEAAGRVSAALHDLRNRLSDVTPSKFFESASFGHRQAQAWDAVRDAFRRILVEDGPLLPDDEERALVALSAYTGRVYVVEVDTDRDELVFVETASEAHLSGLLGDVDAAIERLRRFRRQGGELQRSGP